jgi:hypothetical protein
LQTTVHDLIVEEFYRQEDAGQITRTALAYRLGRKKEQITRWLAAPSNLTLDTLSDLLVGLRVLPKLTIDGVPMPATRAETPAPDLQIAAALDVAKAAVVDLRDALKVPADQAAREQPRLPSGGDEPSLNRMMSKRLPSAQRGKQPLAA